jgi:hypothetical protein
MLILAIPESLIVWTMISDVSQVGYTVDRLAICLLLSTVHTYPFIFHVVKFL